MQETSDINFSTLYLKLVDSNFVYFFEDGTKIEYILIDLAAFIKFPICCVFKCVG